MGLAKRGGVLLVCALLAACGGGRSAKTRGLSIDELKTKLDGLRKTVEGDCLYCDGIGKVMDDETGDTKPCPECKGAKTAEITVGPTTEEFYEAIGEPLKIENKPGDLIWEYWYYKCEEGLVRVHAYEDERRGDVVRVVTGEVELAK